MSRSDVFKQQQICHSEFESSLKISIKILNGYIDQGIIGFECVKETTHPEKKMFPLIGKKLHSQEAFAEVFDRADSSVQM